MEENESKTKVEGEAPEADHDEESMLSLESLDSIISEVDPSFSQGLKDIGPDEPEGIFSEGSELKYSLEDEIELWRHGVIRKLLKKILPGLPAFSFKIKSWIVDNAFSGHTLRVKFVAYVKALPQKTLQSILDFKNHLAAGIRRYLTTFAEFSLLKKMAFVGLILTTGLALTLMGRMATKGLITTEPLFLTSLQAWSQETIEIKSEAKEMFFTSPRVSQHIFLMKKLMANVMRSESSGNNPMGAFEFFIEGTASDAMIEIKDREAEVEDLFLRTIEEMSYDQLDTGEGKQLLCDRLRQDLNQILTKGIVRKVYIKTLILKP